MGPEAPRPMGGTPQQGDEAQTGRESREEEGAEDMGRSIEGFLAMVPPTVTHNDLEAFTRGGRPSIRKSARLKEAEDSLMARMGAMAREAEEGGGPLTGPLSLEVRWCFPTCGRREGGEPHTSRPDVSNMLKTLEDCLVRVGVIDDDRLVCSLAASKGYMDPPGVYIRAEEIG